MPRSRYPEPLATELFGPLDRNGPALLHDQLAERVRGLVQRGSLRPGDYLPPLRLVSSKLDVSVGTVARAYEILVRSGIAGPHGTRGVRVGEAGSFTGGQAWVRGVMRPVVPGDPLSAVSARPQGIHSIRFDVTGVASESIPAGILSRAVSGALDEGGVLGYGPLDGLPTVRAALGEYLRRRGVALDGAAMVLTSGTTQSLVVLAHALVPPGGIVLVEQPTWHVALSIFAAARVRVVGVPVDDDGIQLEPLRNAVLKYGPAFLYLQPSFQNPTGIALSGERRANLLEMARRLHLLVVEDDVAAELGFDTTPPPLRTADSADVVLYLKSFAKLLAPTVRVGLIVAPAPYERAIREAKHGLDPFVSTLGQNIVAHCLKSRGFDRHRRSLAAELKGRWEVLSQALGELMPAGTRWTTPRGGLSAWIEFPEGTELQALLAELAARGVVLTPGDLFCVEAIGLRSARLAFSATPPALIRRGVELIAEGVKEHLHVQGRRPSPSGATPS
jgi:DNA-binding transcriptional MocR family regulator